MHYMTTGQTMTSKTSHPWSNDSLLAKAQRYSQEMRLHSRDDWQFGLTSTFVLEFVARAALANISPTLLADPKDWNNLYFSLGRVPNASKFTPRSIDISTVFSRIADVIPAFTPELAGFAVQHLHRRNEELHTGDNPFEGLKTNWLAHFYEASKILLFSMRKELVFLVGDEESKVAEKLIAASKDESAKAVAKAVSAHKVVWEGMDSAEQSKLTLQASNWATRQAGHRVICPSCKNDALVVGAPIAEPIRKLDGDLIVEAQEYLPAKFECIACRLKIAGLSQLSACSLGATYKATSTYDAVAYYTPEDEHPGFDDDNNEY